MFHTPTAAATTPVTAGRSGISLKFLSENTFLLLACRQQALLLPSVRYQPSLDGHRPVTLLRYDARW
jgi:hypothetical protein